MKLKLIATALLFLSVLSGCKKAKEFTQFNIEYDESVIIQSSAGINLPFDVLTPDMETNSSSKFESNDTRKDKIEEIKLTKLNLTLTSPSSGDFTFLKSIDVYISADGLDEIKLAWIDNVPETVGKFLELSVSDIDFKEYIKRKKDQHNEGSNIVPESLIEDTETKNQALYLENKWNAMSPKQEQIVATTVDLK